MHLTDEERQVGGENFETAVGVVRRDFLRAAIGAGLSLSGGMGPMAFGYGGPQEMKSPVRIGIIGVGDQGGVLIGALQSPYHQVAAICDIRPSSIHRAVHGDWSSVAAKAVRTGLMSKFDWKTEEAVRRNVRVYDDYRELLKSSDVEAVVIALPLHLHHQVTVEALAAGKHVYLETLMARTVTQCKQIAHGAQERKLVCAIGHQRHYSILYQSAAELLKRQLLGQVHAIHAQWHRGNLPGRDSWQPPLPGGERTFDGTLRDDIQTRVKLLKSSLARLKNTRDVRRIEQTERQIQQWTAWNEDRNVDAKRFGYQDAVIAERRRSALEELCRWRLWDRTCGGIMNELGHHQLDGALLLLDALQGQPARPLNVFATGGRSIFPDTRESDDHATCVIQFAGAAYEAAENIGFLDRVSNYPAKGIPGYDQDPQKRISLIYTTTNGNGLGRYGERVLGTSGTLQLQQEQEGLVFKGNSTALVTVEEPLQLSQPTRPLSMRYSNSQPPEAGLAQAVGSDLPSRGYREALEHWAWCIRHPDQENQPRCDPVRALRTAVLTLTCSQAILRGKRGACSQVNFQPEWFDVDSDRTPEEDLKIG